MSDYVFVTLIAIIYGALSGIIGTGSSLLLLPLMIGDFGPRLVMPIMAIAAIMGNLSRIAVWWREIDWRATLTYTSWRASSLVRCACAALFTRMDNRWRAGFVFLGDDLGKTKPEKQSMDALDKAVGTYGGFVGFLTGPVLSTGPVSVLIFTAYGLSRGAFIGTEASSAFLLYISKVGTFAFQHALSIQVVLTGFLVGSGIMLGSLSTKVIV